MDAKEIIAFIQNAEKKTPVKVYLKEKSRLLFRTVRYSGSTAGSYSVTGRSLSQS